MSVVAIWLGRAQKGQDVDTVNAITIASWPAEEQNFAGLASAHLGVHICGYGLDLLRGEICAACDSGLQGDGSAMTYGDETRSEA